MQRTAAVELHVCVPRVAPQGREQRCGHLLRRQVGPGRAKENHEVAQRVHDKATLVQQAAQRLCGSPRSLRVYTSGSSGVFCLGNGIEFERCFSLFLDVFQRRQTKIKKKTSKNIDALATPLAAVW